jgi:glycerate kinase
VGHLVAAPDKFRGTADASQAAAAAARGAHRAGWTASEVPLADGGDGLLSAFAGEARYDEVTGPLGKPVLAEWKLVPGSSAHDGPTAVIEMANASGLLIAGGEENNDPVRATTAGTGQLVMRAVALGAKRVIVGCGGSATTDGGSGALEAIGSPDALRGAELVAACDVTTMFLDAAKVFAPQKGASPEQVEQLTVRLSRLAHSYRAAFDVDVTTLPGAGAAGGLAGGLAALGARIVSGFELVAEFVHLDDHIAGADLVMTGEGRLDRQSFSGKVVGGVISHVAGRVPILCVVGVAAPDVDSDGFDLVSLVERAGPERALSDVLSLIEEVVAERISRQD